jgi:hypothetical protein
MTNYETRCPDCHADGGNGPRCPRHEKELCRAIIGDNRQRIREINRTQRRAAQRRRVLANKGKDKKNA